MIDDKKADIQAASTAAKIVAGLDLVIATICATNGNDMFIGFMVLAGLLWVYGVYMQGKADTIGE
jgi:hypothetical protein